MKKQTIKLIAGIVLAVLIIVAFGIVLKYIEKSGMKKGDNAPTQHSMYIDIVINEEEYETNHHIESYLFIGTDYNESSPDSLEGYHGGQSDFLVLALLDKTANKYALVHIDRNTMLDVNIIDPNGESYVTSFQQINAANFYGLNETQSAENTVNTVSELFGGLPIDGYYSLGLADMPMLNSAVGGVTITVPDDDLKDIDPKLTKGSKVKLSDEQVETFVRSRMTVGEGTNKERMSRQQIFLNALLSELSAKAKNNPNIIGHIFSELEQVAVTNLRSADFSKIANHIQKSEKIEGSDEIGIIEIDGEVRLGRHSQDGLEHEEFYHDPESIVAILEKAIGLKPFSN